MENAAIPVRLPKRSSRYAVRGSKRPKRRPSPSAMVAVVMATATKMTGSVTHAGRPERPYDPK